jgi:hypothetical protein
MFRPMYLVVSTLPHIFSILPLLKNRQEKSTLGYIYIISLSTLCSILYHMFNETNKIATIADYSFAFLWFLYDIYMGYNYKGPAKYVLTKILAGNATVFFIYLVIPYNKSYKIFHSFWHIINACKSFYVSNLIHDTSEKHKKYDVCEVKVGV